MRFGVWSIRHVSMVLRDGPGCETYWKYKFKKRKGFPMCFPIPVGLCLSIRVLRDSAGTDVSRVAVE
jgi:hypothetical protein